MGKITSLDQMRMAAAEAKNFSAQVAAAALEAIEAIEASKQDKLPGSAGQFVGFDQAGNAVPVPPPVRGVTQAEYDALPEAERKTGLFIITDAGSAGGGAVSIARTIRGKAHRLFESCALFVRFGNMGGGRIIPISSKFMRASCNYLHTFPQ